MKLFSGPLSLFARKVEIALQEKGLAFEREMVSFSQSAGYAPKHPEVLAANPKAQVPVLVDGAVTLFDSTVILEYLEEAYPLPPLYPADPEARAQCRLLELTADEIVLAPVRSLMYRSEPPSPDSGRWHQCEAGAKSAEALLLDHYRALQERLGTRRHFCSDFSVADIALYLVLFYAQRLRGPDLAETLRLAAWYERVGGRPAVARVTKEIALADHALSPALATYAR